MTDSPEKTTSDDESAPRKTGRKLAWLPRDILLVITGALLALAAEEWRDTRHRHERTRRALMSIRDELQGNLELIRKSKERNAFLRDTLTRLAALGKLPDSSIYMKAMLNRASVMNTAWQLSMQTGALAETAIDVLLPVAKTYDAQERYSATSDVLGNEIVNDTREFGMEGVLRDRFRQFIPLAIDGHNYEGYLLERYNAAIDRLAPLIR